MLKELTGSWSISESLQNNFQINNILSLDTIVLIYLKTMCPQNHECFALSLLTPAAISCLQLLKGKNCCYQKETMTDPFS